jgi:Domain of unknown function (DUF5667)
MGVLAVRKPVFRPRRAERYAQLLDEAGGARRRHVRSPADAELSGLVTLRQRVGQIPLAAEADPEFRAGLRAMLMATIERDGMGATAIDPEPTIKLPSARHRPVSSADTLRRLRAEPATQTRRPPSPIRSRRTRGAIVVGLAAGAIALSGVSGASGDAIPGDKLYGVKRSTEKAQLALAGSEVTRGQLYLEFARTRLNEATAVGDDPAGLTAVLGDMDDETRQGVRLLTTAAADRRDTAGLDVIDAFVDQQSAGLRALKDDLGTDAVARVNESLELLKEIRERSADLRLTVKDCGGGNLDQLGPRPRYCHGAQPGTGRPGDRLSPGAQVTGSPIAQLPAGTATPDADATTPSPRGPSGSGRSGSGQDDSGLLDNLTHLIDGAFG